MKRLAPDDERLYVRVLEVGTRFAIALLLLGFTVYVTGALDPQVPIARLPELWSLPADQYLAAIGVRPGWGWIAHVARGDLINLIPAALIASTTLGGVAAVGCQYVARGERLLAAVAFLQAVVILIAASGLLAPG